MGQDHPTMRIEEVTTTTVTGRRTGKRRTTGETTRRSHRANRIDGHVTTMTMAAAHLLNQATTDPTTTKTVVTVIPADFQLTRNEL
jgi:hypothetical protein